MKRWQLLTALLVASCAGPTPSAPTDLRSGFTTASETNDATEPVVGFDSDLELETIDAAATAKTFTLTGVVTDKVVAAWRISNATVMATPGSVTARTNTAGQYTLRLRDGTYTIKTSNTGY